MKNIQAKKSLGQHFLKSQKAIRLMITLPKVTKGDHVLEIGPGKGVLTKALLRKGARVTAFELDPRMIEYLQQHYSQQISSGQLTLVYSDIVKTNLLLYTHENPYKVVANIPYYITNVILKILLSGAHPPSVICLLVQKDVAERIISRNGKESILSLSVKLYGQPSYGGKVSRHYFNPKPKVDSAIILIDTISRKNILDSKYEERFFIVIKKAFSQKRKQAITNLQNIGGRIFWEELFDYCGIDRKSRAEDISYSLWKKLLVEYMK